jgi:hypothetical protein
LPENIRREAENTLIAWEDIRKDPKADLQAAVLELERQLKARLLPFAGIQRGDI